MEEWGGGRLVGSPPPPSVWSAAYRWHVGKIEAGRMKFEA